MFDPLMANPPSTPQREESNASPDNSDKENDVPRDPLSLTQYFNRTYHVKGLQKPATPTGKLIDFGDVSIDEVDELAFSGPSTAEVGTQLDDGDAPLSTQLLTDPHEEPDTENPPFLPSNGPFMTPQNRRILGDIDVDALQPPKPPVKQGTLKISFQTAADSGSSPTEAPTNNVASFGPEPDNATPGPVITLYPPTFGSIPPTSSAPQISDKVDDYLSPQLPLPRTAATFTPRRSPLSSEHASHRVSMDLQSSFQLQLENTDYSFDLVNDKVSFLETSQELSFPESDDDSDADEIVEDVNVEDMLKSLTLQDKAVFAAKRIFSPTSEKFSITSIPEKDSECERSAYDHAYAFNLATQHAPSLRHREPSAPSRFHHLEVRFASRWPGQFSDLQLDFAETDFTTTTSHITKKPVVSTRRPPPAQRPSISGLQPVTTALKPPMRVLVPPKRSSLTTNTTQRLSVVRPPVRKPPMTGSLPKPVANATKVVEKLTDGPRRVLVQASDKPAPRTVSTSTTSVSKIQGPQRVLVRTASGTTNTVKRPLGPSSSINPPAPTSRLPAPSRIAVPSTSRPRIGTSGGSKSAGRWI